METSTIAIVTLAIAGFLLWWASSTMLEHFRHPLFPLFRDVSLAALLLWSAVGNASVALLMFRRLRDPQAARSNQWIIIHSIIGAVLLLLFVAAIRQESAQNRTLRERVLHKSI